MVIQPRNRKISFLVIAFVLLIIFLGLSLLSFFYFDQDSKNGTSEGVKFWLYHKQEQVVGEKGNFFVFIQNKEKRDLENIEVMLNFPPEFIFDSSFPTCEQRLNQGCIWSFEKINKNVLQEIKIKGTFLGPVEQPQYFEGRIDFNLSGFTSVFQENFSTAITLEPSLLLNWEIPEHSSFGREIKMSLSLENISQAIIPQTEVVIDWPVGFNLKQEKNNFKDNNKLKDIQIDIVQRQIRWRIKDLNPKIRKGIELSGFINDATINDLKFSLKAGTVFNNEFFPQSQKQKKILLEKFDFRPTLKINDSLKKEQSYSWGKILPITLSYDNKTTQPIENLILKLKINGKKYIDFERLYQSRWHYYKEDSQTESKFLSKQIDSSLISISPQYQEQGWSSFTIPGFTTIPINSKGKIVFDLPLKNYLDLVKDGNELVQVDFQIVAQGNLLNQDLVWEIPGNKINILVKTDLTLNSSVRYYDDEHVIIGQGPLPPKIGEETRYWIFWRLKNTTNAVKDIFVETELPFGVVWTGATKASDGLVLYNQSKRKVSWQIAKLEPYQGGSYSLVEAGFEVAIIPIENQIGEIIPLTGLIYLTAKDQLTNDLLSQNSSFLDTSLKKDIWFQGSGRVISNQE